MKKNYIHIINILSEDRIVVILSSLILCIFLLGCGKNEITFYEEGEADTFNELGEIYESEGIEQDSFFVYVCGAVVDEGVYEFSDEARIVDAIDAAGGFAENACTTAINLSERLSDEQRIYVPTNDEMSAIVEGENADPRININTANKEKLMELKGIGETRADAIIEYREARGGFKSCEEIMNVSGIGQSSFDKIKESIRVD